MKENKRRLKITLFVLFLSCFGVAQNVIKGVVSSNNSKALYTVSVILKDTLKNTTIAYTFTDSNGNYQLKTDKIGDFVLVFSSLGYATKFVSLQLKSETKLLKINSVLEEKPMNLDEVIIKAELPISIRKDTINFKTKFFTNGTEQTVEDLLKKIPGLNIDSEGTIKVGNQEIEKLMVDGDDLFEKGYKILSKNMPAYPIEEVEVLKRYSNNRLLKGIEESNKVALNLKLNEDSKRIWFGNAEVGVGNASFYQLKANLMNFGKKNKYYFLANTNTIGYNATGDLQNLIRPMRFNEPGSIGDDQSVINLLNMSAGNLNFKRNRTNFNNAKLVSLNAIFNPTEKIKIKTLAFFNWDETDFFKNSTDLVNINTTNFTNTEDYTLRNLSSINKKSAD